jgi:hypothetical protein
MQSNFFHGGKMEDKENASHDAPRPEPSPLAPRFDFEHEQATIHTHGVLIDGLIQTVSDLRAEIKQATNRINNLLLLIPALEQAGIVRRIEDGSFESIIPEIPVVNKPVPRRKRMAEKKAPAKVGKKAAVKKAAAVKKSAKVKR